MKISLQDPDTFYLTHVDTFGMEKVEAQAVLFGRREIGGVRVRGSITYRLTNPSRRPGLVCMVYSTPHESYSVNIPCPNNTACGLKYIILGGWGALK